MNVGELQKNYCKEFEMFIKKQSLQFFLKYQHHLWMLSPMSPMGTTFLRS